MYKTKKIHQLHSFRHYKKTNKKTPKVVRYVQRLNESGAERKQQTHLN